MASIELDAAVELLYDSILDDSLFDAAIAGLGSNMGNRRALLIRSANVGHEPAQIVATHRADGSGFESFLTDYGAYYHEYDPTKFRWESVAEHQWLVEDQTENRHVWSTNHFYQDFALVQGIVGWAVLKVGKAGQRGAHDWALTFPRDKGSPAFQPVELEQMQRVSPQLRRAFHLRRKHGELRSLANVGLEALNLYTSPLILAELDGKVRFCNHAAERYLADAQGCLQLKSGEMQARLVSEQARWRNFITCRNLGEAAGIRLRDGNGNEVLAQRLPLGPALHCTTAWQRPLHLIVLNEQSSLHSATPGSILRNVYGFTPAEIRVAQTLVQDCTLNEIAAQGGIMPSTVRSQIKAMLAKTGCRRQAELMRLLVTLNSFGR